MNLYWSSKDNQLLRHCHVAMSQNSPNAIASLIYLHTRCVYNDVVLGCLQQDNPPNLILHAVLCTVHGASTVQDRNSCSVVKTSCISKWQELLAQTWYITFVGIAGTSKWRIVQILQEPTRNICKLYDHLRPYFTRLQSSDRKCLTN
jgi:hypothetical protein